MNLEQSKKFWTRRLGNQMKNRDHPGHSISKLGQNAGKSPGDLRRLDAIQTPVKDHKVMMVWKKRKICLSNSNNNNNNNLAKKLKKLWNMKVTVIPIVIGTLSTVAKRLVQGLEDLEIRGRLDTIEMTALLKSARILRKVLKTWGDLWSLKLQWGTID